MMEVWNNREVMGGSFSTWIHKGAKRLQWLTQRKAGFSTLNFSEPKQQWYQWPKIGNFHKNVFSLTVSCYCSPSHRLHVMSICLWTQWDLQGVTLGQPLLLSSQYVPPLLLQLQWLPSVQSPSGSSCRRLLFFTQLKGTSQCHGFCGEHCCQEFGSNVTGSSSLNQWH